MDDIHPQSSCPDAGPESLWVGVPLGVDTEHAAPRVQLQGGPQPLRLRPGVSHQAVQGPEADRARLTYYDGHMKKCRQCTFVYPDLR